MAKLKRLDVESYNVGMEDESIIALTCGDFDLTKRKKQ